MMSRNKLAGIIVACTIVIVVAIVLVVLKPWEAPASTQTYTLTTAVNPPGTGSVSPSGGQYESGVQVTITATPASGYTFDYWSGSASDTSPTISIAINDDYSITANFVAAPVDRHDLTVSSTEGGSVTIPGDGTFTYDAGTVVDLVAEAEEGYRFVNWTGDVGTIDDVNDATTTITINGEYTITANFVITINITAQVETVDDPDNILGGAINVGDIITGTYTYNPATTDSNALPTVGDYRHTSSPSGITVNAGGFVFQTDPGNVDFLVEIVNDHGTTARDNYLLRSYNNLPLANGALVEHIAWQLDDPTATAISSEALPTTPPILTHWESTFGLTLTGHDPDDPMGSAYFVRAHVTAAE
jgi:uncharacterized repeat protein (TIGR02543 family)